MTYNQNPKQFALDEIDCQLLVSGRVVQSKNKFNLAAAQCVAVREYRTDIGPADGVLFVKRKPACLTVTPDNRTFGYFNQNLVSDYGYEKAVIDGVLVPYNVFEILANANTSFLKL